MRAPTKRLVLAIALLSTACADDVLAPDAGPGTRTAPAPVFAAADARDAIEGRWIVVLHEEGGASSAAPMLARSGGRVERTFGGALHGFVATLSDDELERLRRDPAVAYVEQDAVVRVSSSPETPWNLARIGHAPLPVRAGIGATGAGVNVYVIDTGIRLTHAEFGRRARAGFDAVGGASAGDCNGHGTHVAGTIAGATRGVAPRASLVSVRVLDCGGAGTLSDVIAGIDWVAAHHEKPAVANLSISGGASRAADEAVQRAIDAGVVFVVAAGNDARDACDYSPARTRAAITVGATTQADAVWALSNQGACVDLFAPGVDIESAAHDDDAATRTMSGTSMAAPHAAGAAALRLEQNPRATPGQVEAMLRDAAASGRLDRLAAGSPDLLLQVRVVPSWRDLRGFAR